MNLLPLDAWFASMGFNQWHAWGFADQDALAVTSSCNPVMFEESSQGYDAVGRADIRSAIETAESRLYQYLGYWPAPKFYDTEITPSRMADKRFTRAGSYDAGWYDRWRNTRLRDNWIVASGIEGLTLVQANAPVTYSDVQSDGYYDYFQIGPIATTITDVREVAIYFNSVDRYDGSAVGETWRVEPIRVTISAGQMTITGKPWLLGRPVLSTGVQPSVINPADPANFASSVDVYRRYVNRDGTTTDTSQAVVYWQTRPCHGWWCCCGGSCCSCATDPFTGAVYDPAAMATATARVGIRDPRRGIVTPAEAAFNATSGVWEGFPTTVCWEPDRFLIRLYAGYPLTSLGLMDKRFHDVVARLAAAELQQSICGCAEAERRVYYWQQDLSKTGADKELFSVSAKQLDNPFGTRRGHWYAWNFVENMARVTGHRV